MGVYENTSEVKKNGIMIWTRKENARKQIVTGNLELEPEGTRRDDLKRDGRMELDGA